VRLCKLQKRWFSPGTPASSTTKTGRHDIAESGVKHQKSNQIIVCVLESQCIYKPQISVENMM
jgi:hypothetical protein